MDTYTLYISTHICAEHCTHTMLMKLRTYVPLSLSHSGCVSVCRTNSKQVRWKWLKTHERQSTTRQNQTPKTYDTTEITIEERKTSTSRYDRLVDIYMCVSRYVCVCAFFCITLFKPNVFFFLCPCTLYQLKDKTFALFIWLDCLQYIYIFFACRYLIFWLDKCGGNWGHANKHTYTNTCMCVAYLCDLMAHKKCIYKWKWN